MVKKIDVLAEFKPANIKREVEIPVFHYDKTIQEELDEGNITKKMCLDMLDAMLLIRNLEEMIVELKENKGRYGPLRQFLIAWQRRISLSRR